MSASATTIARRTWFRWTRVCCGAVIVPLVFAGLYVHESRARLRELELAAAIRKAGGRIDLRPQLRDRITAFLKRQPVPGTAVFLGQRIDDAWIDEQEALRGLSIDSLTIGNVALSGAGVARLLSAQPVKILRANTVDLTDESIDALADNGNLRELSIAYTTLTDAQFSRLPLEQLKRLDISGTKMTVAGLRELNRCTGLRRLDLDVHQLRLAPVQTLQELPRFEELSLCGAEVTDDDLLLLHELTTLKRVRLWSTSVTESGMESLRKVLPGCLVGEFD